METIISIIDSAVVRERQRLSRYGGKHGKGNIHILSSEDEENVTLAVPMPNADAEVQVTIPKELLKVYIKEI